MPALRYDASLLARLRASGPTQIDPSMSPAEIARAICRQWLTAFLQSLAATHRGDDVEALHNMRVSARRLEAAIRLFREYLPAWAVESRSTLRTQMRALGNARDWDVQIEFCRGAMAQLGNAERADLEPLEASLAAGRARAQMRLRKTLQAPPSRQWLTHWVDYLSESPAPSSDVSPRAVGFAPAGRFALAAIRQQYRRVRRAADRLTAESSAEDYHDVRSRVKRLRYVLEAFAPLSGESGANFLRRLVRVQDVLGEYQDAEVRARRLAALARRRHDPLPGATLLLMGRIVERDSRIGHKARRRFPRVYGGIRGRPWKRLRGSLVACTANGDVDLARSSLSSRLVRRAHRTRRHLSTESVDNPVGGEPRRRKFTPHAARFTH